MCVLLATWKVARAASLRRGRWRRRFPSAKRFSPSALDRASCLRHFLPVGGIPIPNGGTHAGLPLMGFLMASKRSAGRHRRRLDDKRSGLFLQKKGGLFFVDFPKCCSLLYINNLTYFTERDFARWRWDAAATPKGGDAAGTPYKFRQSKTMPSGGFLFSPSMA